MVYIATSQWNSIGDKHYADTVNGFKLNSVDVKSRYKELVNGVYQPTYNCGTMGFYQW